MPNDLSNPETGTERLRYCKEHKAPCEKCNSCNTYSYCPTCGKCYEPECTDS